MHKTTVTS